MPLHLTPGTDTAPTPFVGGGANPGWRDTYVPPADEWNAWWSRKVDTTSMAAFQQHVEAMVATLATQVEELTAEVAALRQAAASR